MLSLFSTLGGLLISGLPKLLEFFQNKADQAHELKLAELSNLEHEVTILNSKISLVVTSDNKQASNTGAELAREKLRQDMEKEIQKNRDDIQLNRQHIAVMEDRLSRSK